MPAGQATALDLMTVNRGIMGGTPLSYGVPSGRDAFAGTVLGYGLPSGRGAMRGTALDRGLPGTRDPFGGR